MPSGSQGRLDQLLFCCQELLSNPSFGQVNSLVDFPCGKPHWLSCSSQCQWWSYLDPHTLVPLVVCLLGEWEWFCRYAMSQKNGVEFINFVRPGLVLLSQNLQLWFYRQESCYPHSAEGPMLCNLFLWVILATSSQESLLLSVLLNSCLQ